MVSRGDFFNILCFLDIFKGDRNMYNLLNHTELVLNIINANVDGATEIYEEKVHLLLVKTKNIHDIRKFLYTVNIFIYSYMVANNSMSLDKICYRNLKLIDESNSEEELIELGIYIIKSYVKDSKDIIIGAQNEVVKKALCYIHENINSDITLEKVAEYAHVSRTYLCYLFKKGTGYKFCQYVNMAKINLAKDLLQKTSASLEVISDKCGFKSQSYFCATFKKCEGITPNQYRYEWK